MQVDFWVGFYVLVSFRKAISTVILFKFRSDFRQALPQFCLFAFRILDAVCVAKWNMYHRVVGATKRTVFVQVFSAEPQNAEFLSKFSLPTQNFRNWFTSSGYDL